ncbi:hypothetical protein RI367_000165 [Sorochytrium milnesiophthora]
MAAGAAPPYQTQLGDWFAERIDTITAAAEETERSQAQLSSELEKLSAEVDMLVTHTTGDSNAQGFAQRTTKSIAELRLLGKQLTRIIQRLQLTKERMNRVMATSAPPQ